MNDRLTISEYIGQNSRVKSEIKLQILNYPLHRHEYFEIELILGGTGTLLLNGKKYLLKKGIVTYTSPTDFHELGDVDNLLICNISFSFSALPDTFASQLLGIKSCALELDDEYFSRQKQLGYLLADAYKSQQSAEYIGNLLQCFLLQLIKLSPERSIKTVRNALIQNALMYIKLHFHENPTLDQVSSYVHLSPNYFSQLFRQETGQTFQFYLSDLKLHYGAKLLRTTSLSVTDICFACGYTSIPNFLKNFKKKYNLSPLQYRKSTCSNK